MNLDAFLPSPLYQTTPIHDAVATHPLLALSTAYTPDEWRSVLDPYSEWPPPAQELLAPPVVLEAKRDASWSTPQVGVKPGKGMTR